MEVCFLCRRVAQVLTPQLVGTIEGLADPSTGTWSNDITPPTPLLIPSEMEREATNTMSSPKPRPSSPPGYPPQNLPHDTREVIPDAGNIILELNAPAYDNPMLERFYQSSSAIPNQKHDFHSKEFTRFSDPLQTTQISRMSEPTIPTENLYTPYSDPGGSDSAGVSTYRNDSPGPYGPPPLPHQTYQPGQLVNPHTDSSSCKRLVSLGKALFDPFAVGYTDIENVTLSRGLSGSIFGHSRVNLDRSDSISTSNTGGEPIVIGASSSVATSIYRCDSMDSSGVSSPPQEYTDIKVELRKYNANLVFKVGEEIVRF